MPEFNAEGRLLLGTCGWLRADWLVNYYPDDLPEDWRLAFYANDCDAVLLLEDLWLGGDDIADVLDEEAPENLHFFLQADSAEPGLIVTALGPFPKERTVLLVPQRVPEIDVVVQWIAHGDDLWLDPASGACAQCWRIDSMDLRELRKRAEVLAPQTQALLLDGPGANPSKISDLRTLLQLVGKD